MEMPGADDMSETDKINVVPLADVTLVLLIIMMVLSPMVMSSMIKVMTPNLSKVAKKTPEKIPDPLLIKITSKGIFLNNTPVESEEFLGEQIEIKLQDDPDRPVIVSADDNIQVGSVVSILDIAKQKGAEKVSLVKGGKTAS